MEKSIKNIKIFDFYRQLKLHAVRLRLTTGNALAAAFSPPQNSRQRRGQLEFTFFNGFADKELRAILEYWRNRNSTSQ
jgi:hypothetical protein